MTSFASSCRFIARPLHQRRGGIAVEMVLVLVVMAIVTIGIVQFGVFLANAQQVALAARVGALAASQTDPLPPGGTVPAEVVAAVEHQLQSSGIDWCQIRLEHNVAVDVAALESTAGPPCDCDPKTNLANPPFPETRYVRLSVCVPLSQVLPQQLSFFGQQIYGPRQTYEHSALYRYEIGTP